MRLERELSTLDLQMSNSKLEELKPDKENHEANQTVI